MAFEESLVTRIHGALARKRGAEEKKMGGGVEDAGQLKDGIERAMKFVKALPKK